MFCIKKRDIYHKLEFCENYEHNLLFFLSDKGFCQHILIVPLMNLLQ